MYCHNCGADLLESAKFCSVCGQPISIATNSVSQGIGYSNKINDPAFAKYIKNSNRWAAIFSTVLAVAAIVGFYIYGESSSEMDNPQSLYIGLGIGGVFLLIAIFTIIGKKRSRTWDGVVVDKTVKSKTRRQGTNDDYYIQYYTEYVVIVREDNGKTHRMVDEDCDTVFNYYQIGDRVRHHAGLNSYEKYDKTHDRIIFCNACATLCDINDDYCSRCKCPLLK